MPLRAAPRSPPRPSRRSSRSTRSSLHWDVSTRQTNEGFIRRTIRPALAHIEVRKVRGPILDQLYARLKRCGDLSCTGRPFIEHRNIPALVIKARDRRLASQQVADMLAEAIQSGRLAPGDELPSIAELSSSHGIGTGVIRGVHRSRSHGHDLIVAGHPGERARGGRPSEDAGTAG
jgi:hypothetical protein